MGKHWQGISGRRNSLDDDASHAGNEEFLTGVKNSDYRQKHMIKFPHHICDSQELHRGLGGAFSSPRRGVQLGKKRTLV
jgi:hypothetical protein